MTSSRLTLKAVTELISINKDRIIEAFVTGEVVDYQGDLVPVDVLLKSMDIWFELGAVIIDSHSNRPVGRGLEFEKRLKDNIPVIWLKYQIFDKYRNHDRVWKAIQNGEYLGMSIGGEVILWERECNDLQCYRKITALDLDEISPVDEPANPMAVILAKMNSIETFMKSFDQQLVSVELNTMVSKKKTDKKKKKEEEEEEEDDETEKKKSVGKTEQDEEDSEEENEQPPEEHKDKSKEHTYPDDEDEENETKTEGFVDPESQAMVASKPIPAVTTKTDDARQTVNVIVQAPNSTDSQLKKAATTVDNAVALNKIPYSSATHENILAQNLAQKSDCNCGEKIATLEQSVAGIQEMQTKQDDFYKSMNDSFKELQKNLLEKFTPTEPKEPQVTEVVNKTHSPVVDTPPAASTPRPSVAKKDRTPNTSADPTQGQVPLVEASMIKKYAAQPDGLKLLQEELRKQGLDL